MLFIGVYAVLMFVCVCLYEFFFKNFVSFDICMKFSLTSLVGKKSDKTKKSPNTRDCIKSSAQNEIQFVFDRS